ncbi:MAG: glycoside hydrolase domain-containing protein [bacterium]
MRKFSVGAVCLAVPGVTLCCCIDRAKATSVWAVTNTVKIGQTDPVQTSNYFWSGTKKSVAIKSARNEHESFQLVITADSGGLFEVDVEASDLIGPGTIPEENITLYREAYYDATDPPGYVGSGLGVPGVYPDALIPFVDPDDNNHQVGAPFNIQAGENQPIWVKVFVPPGVPAGEYAGSILISDNSGLIDVLTLELTVWDFDLPNVLRLKADYPLDGWWLLPGQYDTAPNDTLSLYRVWDRYYDFLASYSITPTFFYLEPKCINFPDSVYLDFSYCDTLYEHLLDENGLPLFDTPDVYNSNAWPPYCIADESGQYYEEAQFSDPVFVKKVKQFYRQLYDHYVEKGWVDKHYVFVYDETEWVSDEPYNNPPEGYDRARSWADLVHAAHPDLKFHVADNPIPYSSTWGTLIGYADMWTSYIDEIDLNPDLFAERQAAGEEVGAVINEYCDFIDYDAFYHRSIGWFCHKYRLSWMSEWEVAYWVDENDEALNPWLEKPNPQWGHGAGALLWPGKDIEGDPAKSIDDPVPSLRLELNRESLEDYEYLHLLEQVVGEAYVKGLVLHVLPTALRETDPDPHLYYSTRELIGNILGGASVSTASIMGSVTDSAGTAIRGAFVSNGLVSTVTTEVGSYQLPVSAGEQSINVSHGDFISQSQSLAVRPDTTITLDFELIPIPKSSAIFNSFDDPSDLDEWEWEGVQISFSSQHVTEGSHSLKGIFSDATDPYLGTWEFGTGWSGYHSLELDVYNQSDFYTGFGVAIIDKLGNWYGYEENETFDLLPNSFAHIVIPFENVAEKVDLDNLEWLEIIVETREELEGGGTVPLGSRVLYLDNLRLVRITGSDTTAPAPPWGLNVVQDGGAVSLSWSAPLMDADGGSLTGLVGYNVYRSNVSGQSYLSINSFNVIGTNFTDTEVVNDSTYYYVVTALDDADPANESLFSEEVNITLTGAVPGDVNGDGTVNVLDIVRAVNIILGIGDPATEYERWAADCNGDGGVDILDVVGIVNLILGVGSCSQ